MKREKAIELAKYAGYGTQLTNGQPHIWGGEHETQKLEVLIEGVINQCIFEVVHESATGEYSKDVQDFVVNAVNRIRGYYGVER